MTRAFSISAFLLFSVSAFAASVDPIDPLRLPSGGTWTNKVGVLGGIPDTSTMTRYTNFSSSATAAMIQAAVNACPSNQVVFCSNGTYTISTSISIDRDGVVIVGGTNSDGTPGAIFNNTATNTITIGATSGWNTADSANWTTRNISSGNTRGSTSIVVATAPTGLAAGMIMWLLAPSSAAVRGSGFSDFFGTRPASQIVTVASVSGTTVTFDPPVNQDYWTGTAIIAYHATGDTRHKSGLENIKLWRSGGTLASFGYYVQMNGTDQCWLKNCRFYWVGHSTYMVYLYACNRTEIRRCHMDKADLGTDASSTYAIVQQQCSGTWVEDNYFHNMANMMPVFGMSCSAFTYNYVNDLPYSTLSPDWLSQIVYYHGSHNAYNLFEGNWCAAHYNDHTPGSKNTLYFRERGRGWDATPSPNGKQSNSEFMNEDAVSDGISYHENAVIAGCVLGETNSVFHHTAWSNSVSGLPIIGLRAQSWASLKVTNNYAWVSNAVLSGLAAGQELVKSYIYFDQRPSYWGGAQPWPWVDPTNTAKSLASYTYTNFPAGYRSLFITNPPATDVTAPVLSNVGVPSIPGTSSATVTWTTDDVCTNNWLTYSIASDLSSPTSVTNATTGTSESVSLNGLTASTLYYYAAYSVNMVGLLGQSTTNNFTTATPAAVSLLGIPQARIRQ